jgi:hypothetical protein
MPYGEDPAFNQLIAATDCYVQFSGGFSRAEARPFPCPPSEVDFAAVADRDCLFVWPVESLEASGLRYPLTLMPESVEPEYVYYDLELYLGREYVYRTSELIEPFASETCAACGVSLDVPSALIGENSLFYYQLYRHCPACGAEFRPEDRAAIVNDPRDRDAGRLVPGGATSRFALAVECGKCWEYGAVPTEEFLTTCEEALGCCLEHVLDGSF